MKYQIKEVTLLLVVILTILSSCSNQQVTRAELIGKFSVTSNNDLKTKDLDVIFLTETFGKLTELEFFESGLLNGIVEGDPFGTGVNYGMSFDSVKWELDKNTMKFTIPSEDDKGEQTETIKKVQISKNNNNIVLKTNNVIYNLKDK